MIQCLFSIIIPSYNRAHIVKRAIQVVLEQTYQDFEIIIVDDGSVDNTEEIIKELNDSRIKYIYQKHQDISKMFTLILFDNLLP